MRIDVDKLATDREGTGWDCELKIGGVLYATAEPTIAQINAIKAAGDSAASDPLEAMENMRRWMQTLFVADVPPEIEDWTARELTIAVGAVLNYFRCFSQQNNRWALQRVKASMGTPTNAAAVN